MTVWARFFAERLATSGKRSTVYTADQTLRGIISIPVTPFDASYALDEDGLRRVVRFTLDCGAHALLTPVNASEFFTLSDMERRRVLEITLDEVSGSVTAQSTTLAVEFARHAQQHGAAAVNAMPPHVTHPDPAGCYAFYQALSAAVDIPIMIQNFNPPIGTPMGAELIVRMVRELPKVSYVKEETLPEPLRISRLLAAAAGDPRLRAVFGGHGGIYMLDELRRGAAGNMPACHATDALVAVWDAWQAGDAPRAQALHDRLLPLFSFERCYGGIPVYKEVLRRRGVLRCTLTRLPEPPLDDAALRELDRILADIGDLIRR
jgi:dihydrodipicolinate synthase/N-acetylneuraminate lyase